MKEFFKTVFASMLGMVLSFFVIFIIMAIIVAGIFATVDGDEVKVTENSVIHINLDRPIQERSSKNPFEKLDILGLDSKKSLGLNDILSGIKRAKSDDKIEGLYLDMSSVQAGFATIEEIRNALIDFKKSGKFIIAYSEVYSQSAYYLASVADRVYINPEGLLEFNGLRTELAFFKGALDKLQIDAQVIKVGTYKSAVEPFIMEKMSDANRQQITSFLGSMYDHMLTAVSASRRIPKDSLFAIANQLKVQQASDAVKVKLVDGLRYKDQVLDELKNRTGIDKKKEVNAVALADYSKARDDEEGDFNNRVAIVYASGEIMGGEGDDETIGSERMSRAIRKARMDEKVKAVVLRVNSPGGSALASDVIWREVVLTKKVKPVIVSMGDVAASGGYYIACGADSIFAQPNTITGSIGVFGIVPNLEKFLSNKLGITFDRVKTAEYADLGSVTRPLTDGERLIIQNEVNRIYNTFIKRVADGRKKSPSYVDQIGQGRVWSGQEALQNGLVDKLGNIHDAIRAAAKMAKLSDYRVVDYPQQKDPFESFFNTSEDKLRDYLAKREMGESYSYYQQMKQALNLSGIQARLPYQINIK